MKKFKIFLLILLIILGCVFLFWDDILDFYSGLSLRLSELEEVGTSLIEEVEKHISTPPPLRIEEENPQSFLTKTGVIYWTNIQREKYNLPTLKENTKLNDSARLKAEDMFGKQYFSHDSPSGERVGDIVESTSYEFIAIGENLAMGNFKNDEELVRGWMESSGHRENILNSSYQEIGVAVIRDEFEGELTWIAVQHFGKPLTACSLPEETLKSEIETNEEQIEAFQEVLNAIRIQIKKVRPKRGPLYDELIEQYNSVVNQYNNLIIETENLIKEYNIQVKLFNECATGG